MRLTRFTDIALRALLYLGTHRDGPLSSSRLAEALDVSREHLLKSLRALDAEGLVSATRGPGGGFELVAGREGVRIGELVRALEPSVALAECFEADSSCPLEPGCGLASALATAREAFFDALDRHTLSDLLERSRPRLVAIARARPESPMHALDDRVSARPRAERTRSRA